MKYYKSENGEVFAYESDGSQDKWISPSLAAMNADEVDQHLNPKQTLDDIKAAIAARRYDAEVSGIAVNGVFVDTGRESQTLTTSAALSAMIESTYVCNWKTSKGFVQFDAATLIALAQQIRAHVQACFDRESALLDLLEKGNYKDYLLDEGWPNVTVPE